MPKYHKDPDTLEKIVADAIEREKRINKEHPERHGYGMIEGEANDLIRRIENLEIKQEHAQKEKVRNREKRIRMIGRDKLYSRSPEDIVCEEEERKPLKNSIEETLDKFTDRRSNAYSLHEQGYKNVEIADIMGVSRFVVGREIKGAEEELRNKLMEDGFNDIRTSTGT